MAREKVDNKLNVVIGTKAQIEGDTSIPENSIIVVTDEEGSGGGGGGIATSTVNIPFTEVMTETQTNIEVKYSYVGADPVNFTADFSNFTLVDGITLNMPGVGEVTPSMAVGALFGKTTLNYFEMIILFRYLITATLAGAIIGVNGGEIDLSAYTNDYAKDIASVFEGLVIDEEVIAEVFTVDFMAFCQDIPFYNTMTGRGSIFSVTVETVGDISGFNAYSGVFDRHFTSAWDYIKAENELMGYTNHYIQYIGGMTLKFFPHIKMKPNYNGGRFLD